VPSKIKPLIEANKMKGLEEMKEKNGKGENKGEGN
jgi:hypothetical protein